jgi:cyclomaltodextrinase / maltogenic alpha-amylase / neopullulanase
MDSHDKVRYMAYADGDIELGSPDAGEISWTNPPQVDNESSHDKLVLHLAYILTIPGIPILYYGDEIGMTGAADPDNRRMMRFDDELNDWELETLDAAIKMVNFRKDHSALRYGDFQTLAADENNYIYLRSDGQEKILVALNKSESTQNIKINLPDFYNFQSAIDLITGEKEIQFNNSFEFEIPPIGFRIFKLE